MEKRRVSLRVQQKITIFTGKGGVGKSTLALSYALNLASQGKKTLLVELGKQSYFSMLYDKPASFSGVRINGSLQWALWDGESCLYEYIRHIVKVPKLANLFFQNRVMKSLVGAAPGLKEIAITGKLTSEVRNWGPSLAYDEVVLDAYATGHFLSLVGASKGLGDTISVGPIGEQSRNILNVLRGSQVKTYVVTIPERLALEEGCELIDQLEQKYGMSSQLILNRSMKQPLNKISLADAKSEFAKYLKAKIQREEEALSEVEMPYMVFPFTFLEHPRMVSEELSEAKLWKN